MYPDIYKVCDNASLKEAKRLEDEVVVGYSYCYWGGLVYDNDHRYVH